MNRMWAVAGTAAVAWVGANGVASGAVVFNNLGPSPYGYTPFGPPDGGRYGSGSNLGGEWFLADGQHAAPALTVAINDATDVSSYETLTSGYRTLVTSSPLIPGDANLDGKVDFSDLTIVLANFGTTTSLWTNGNFDNAPTIDLTDLTDVLSKIDPGVTIRVPIDLIVPPRVPAPEPASLAILTFGMLSLLTASRK